jgi:hypothetical protein
MVAQLHEEGRATSRPDGSDARLRALTEHALEIITVQNADGTFTYANEAVVLSRLFGQRIVGARPRSSCIPTMPTRCASDFVGS